MPKIDCKSAIHTIQSRSFTFWSVWICFEFASNLLERVTPWTFLKNYTSSMDHPWKKKQKPKRWETFPSDFHSTGALSRWIFWTTIQVSLLWAPSQIWDVNSAQFFYVFSGAKKTMRFSSLEVGRFLNFLSFFGDPAPKIQFRHFFYTPQIPISHVSHNLSRFRFLVHKQFSKPVKTVHIVLVG